MIRCARLRPYNYRTGDVARSFTVPSGLQLTAGFETTPSPVRLVTDETDWRILGEHPQVERFEVADMAALQARLGQELTTRMLAGGTAALAPVVDAPRALAAGPLPVIGLEPVGSAAPVALADCVHAKAEPPPAPLPAVVAPPAPKASKALPTRRRR